MGVVLEPRVARVADDPESFWPGRLDVGTRKAARICFRGWMRWLNQQNGW